MPDMGLNRTKDYYLFFKLLDEDMCEQFSNGAQERT